MHTPTKLGSFMALRANGWSLAKISKELNVSKSTLWEWDNQNKNEIHLLKHHQLEKLQERYLPTYEEELSKLRSYLDRLESALENQDFARMGPEYVLQTALQLRARLGKMREQVPLRNVPFNEPLTPLPFTGCVSRQDAQKFREEYFEGESVEDARESADTSSHGVPPGTSRSDRGSGGPAPLIHSSNNPLIPDPSIQPSTNPATDHAQTSSASNTSDPIREISEIRGSDENTNRTFPDETPPRSKNRPLYHNDFRVPRPNRRPVLPSENDHANGNGHPNGNGNGHVNGNGRLP